MLPVAPAAPTIFRRRGARRESGEPASVELAFERGAPAASTA